MEHFPVLGELAALFAAAVVVVALLQRLRFPAIIGLILTGALVGPLGLGLVDDRTEVEELAELGVVALLFGVGLELPLSKLRRMLDTIVGAGTLQLAMTIAVVAAAGAAVGMEWRAAVVVGCVIAVSSTAIVLRGLQERRELDAPHGRAQLGILVFQDLAVVPMILLLPWLGGIESEEGVAGPLLRAAGLLVGLLVVGRPVVARLLGLVARTRQAGLFVLAVLAIALGTAWLTALAGASLALGAFLAGMVVASSEYRHQALAELLPFREAFTSIFFLSIGMLLRPAAMLDAPLAVGGLVAFIIVGKAIILMVIGAVLRKPLRVAVFVSLGLAQVGEFSFLVLEQALDLDLLSKPQEEVLLVSIILTMLLAPFLARVAPAAAQALGRVRWLARCFAAEATSPRDGLQRSGHVLVAGYGLAGIEMSAALKRNGRSYLVVDLNPDNVLRAREDGHPALYGDIARESVLLTAGAPQADRLVLAVNDPAAAEQALAAVRRVAPSLRVLVRTPYLADVEPLRQAGADEVLPAELESAAELVARVLREEGVVEDEIARELAQMRGRYDCAPLPTR